LLGFSEGGRAIFILQEIAKIGFRRRAKLKIRMTCGSPELCGCGGSFQRALPAFLYHRKLRKELQSEKRCDIMRKQKESVTKRGGDNTSKKRYFCSHL